MESILSASWFESKLNSGAISAHSWALFRKTGPWRRKRTWERRESVTLNDFLTCYLHVVRDQMGCEIHFHQGIPDPGHSEDGHHLVEDGLGGIQIVGPEILEDCFQEEASSEDVICERKGRSVKTLKKGNLL